MIEKVNPMHPDKIADRIAGALVDMAYRQDEKHRAAVEVLIGHGKCHIINETTAELNKIDVFDAVARITGRSDIEVFYDEYRQDTILSGNQEKKVRCGDNGIFRGAPLTTEQKFLSMIARQLYKNFPTDGKYILDGDKLIVCQSCATVADILDVLSPFIAFQPTLEVEINPLGYWTGGIDVDTGATNRKLGSDMADSVTGGGLHGKDLSKADVAANIYCFQRANGRNPKIVEASCAIGDEFFNVDSFGVVMYKDVVDEARKFIELKGGFEKFAEWGLW